MYKTAVVTMRLSASFTTVNAYISLTFSCLASSLAGIMPPRMTATIISGFWHCFAKTATASSTSAKVKDFLCKSWVLPDV